jgi:5'-3' exonuclease
MNTNYKKLFDSLKEEKDELALNSRVLVIDGLNIFLRAFAAVGWIDKNLSHIGGLTGFLRSLGYAIKLVRPTRVIIVFDGKGSSTNKRYIYPEYKANRGLTKITTWEVFETQQDESDAIKNQIVRLVQYLKTVPVDLISIDKIEADDVIGWMTSQLKDEIVIMSSDKDYLQLVDEKISVYSPTKKKFYEANKVTEEFGVTPKNFLTQKILLGDTGDNVPGVKGLGVKTMLKLFPELGTNKEVTLEQILEKCTDGSKIHEKIRNFTYQLNINKKLMDLKEPNISDEAKEEIKSVLLNPNKSFSFQDFVELYKEDDLGNSIPNLEMWLFNSFNELQKYK